VTKVISEIGWNHLGDIELAKEMISASFENGADFVKFQTWSVDRLKSGPWDNDGRSEIYKKAELKKEHHFELFEFSNKLGIEFFTSVFSIEDAALLKDIQTKNVKIASFESRNLDLLSYCNDNFSNIYLSTGTSSVGEIQNSLAFLNKADVTLLHCVSSYPLKPKNANLPRILSLKKICNKVGYSDHTEGISGAIISLEFEPTVIEKHFTINQNLAGRDNKFSILPDELKMLKNHIKIRSEMKIAHGDSYLDCEKEAREIMTGRFNS